MREIKVEKNLWFINVGVETEKQHEEHKNKIELHTLRKWENCLKYGFLSAGQGTKWKKQIEKVEVGDILCAYITQYGFAGIGKCLEKSKPIKDYKISKEPFKGKKLTEVELIQETHIHEYNLNDVYKCEYVIDVDWLNGFYVDKKQDAKSVKGLKLGITQHIVTDLKKSKAKIDFIQNAFKLKFIL